MCGCVLLYIYTNTDEGGADNRKLDSTMTDEHRAANSCRGGHH
jgi:hypothetical protein